MVETAFNDLGAVRTRHLEETDALPWAVRECVHEFGLPIVRTCLKFGIKNPAHIREFVKEIWAGARQIGQSGDARRTLDWLLMQAGSGISATTLMRVLQDSNLVICSSEPTRAMLNASMNELNDHSVRCTKEEKHRRRLRAALRAGMVANSIRKAV